MRPKEETMRNMKKAGYELASDVAKDLDIGRDRIYRHVETLRKGKFHFVKRSDVLNMANRRRGKAKKSVRNRAPATNGAASHTSDKLLTALSALTGKDREAILIDALTHFLNKELGL